jgi:hypothetical protein
VARNIRHHKLVEWPDYWPFEAVFRCYKNALSNANRGNAGEHEDTKPILYRLMRAYTDERFVRTEERDRQRPIPVGDDKVGLVHQPKGKNLFLCVFDEEMTKLAGDSVKAESLRAHLRRIGVLVEGHGSVGTAQETIPIRRHGNVIPKPRVWRLDYNKFIGLLNGLFGLLCG